MDDPWGSPWATTDTDKEAKPPSPSKSARSDLEPPPRAFLSSSGSPRIPAISAPSPWANDDDGFGDWARPQTPAQTQSGWGGGGWGAPSPNLASPPREDVFAGASPIAWPGSIAFSKPANGGSLRHPSPDPWSTEFSPSIDGSSTPRLAIDEPSVPITTLDRIEDRVDELDELKPAWGGGDSLSVEGKEQEDTLSQTTSIAGAVADTPEAPATSGSGLTQDDTVRLSVESAPRSHGSPFSSASGDDTDLEDDRQDSPITSIDEDAKIRHTGVRKTSGRVQQLVDKFDGLARAASEEPPIPRSEHSKSPLHVDEDGVGEQTEFGDFEEAHKDMQLASTPERPTTPHPTERALPESGPSTAVSSPQSAEKPVAIAVAAYGAIEFNLDTGIVGKLFNIPEPESLEVVTGTNISIPDHIIDDSFTEISERKTWYRISRMGSSRKYNAGDDENYRLVTWPTSIIREDTIKVVRRWMEEDSIAGRVTLGGGVSKTQKNMFGWDSSAEPVALDAVFRKKSHTRASSLQSSAVPLTREVSSALRSPVDRPSSVAITPVATFGWSTNSPSSEPSPRSTRMRPPPSQPVATPTSIPPPATQSAPKLRNSPPAIPSRLVPASNGETPGQNDDDDEWGEMVSSPSELQPATDGCESLDATFSAPAASSTSIPMQRKPTPSKATASSPSQATLIPPPSASDPWDSVDLSAFESTPKMASVPAILNNVPGPSLSVAQSRTPPVASGMGILPVVGSKTIPSSELQPVPPVPKQATTCHPFTPTTPLDIRPPVATREDADGYFEHNNISSYEVGQIIANLPDLSYMLR